MEKTSRDVGLVASVVWFPILCRSHLQNTERGTSTRFTLLDNYVLWCDVAYRAATMTVTAVPTIMMAVATVEAEAGVGALLLEVGAEEAVVVEAAPVLMVAGAVIRLAVIVVVVVVVVDGITGLARFLRRWAI